MQAGARLHNERRGRGCARADRDRRRGPASRARESVLAREEWAWRRERVLSVTVYLADVDDWGKFNDIYKETFRAPYPTRTAVGASLRDILIEVSAVAYVSR